MRSLFSALSREEGGFTLIEVAIVLAILGILGGLSLPMFAGIMDRKRLEVTREHQRQIKEALETYLVYKAHLPCPANPAESGPNAGKAQRQCGQNFDAIGLVPYQTLGLSESVAKDGWGQYMTFVTEPQMNTIDHPTGLHSFCAYLTPTLKLNGPTGPQAVMSEGYIVYILISHGESRHGAFKANGTRERITNPKHGPRENVNAQDTFTFAMGPYSSDGSDLFRQSVIWDLQYKMAGVCRIYKQHSLAAQDPQRPLTVGPPQTYSYSPAFNTPQPTSAPVTLNFSSRNR